MFELKTYKSELCVIGTIFSLLFLQSIQAKTTLGGTQLDRRLAALEMKEFDDEVPPVPSYLNLSKPGTLLGPALPHLVQAFSPENRVRTEFKLRRIVEGSWKELEHRFSLKQPS